MLQKLPELDVLSNKNTCNADEKDVFKKKPIDRQINTNLEKDIEKIDLKWKKKQNQKEANNRMKHLAAITNAGSTVVSAYFYSTK